MTIIKKNNKFINKFQVALQFPDDLLSFSIKTISRLKDTCLSKDCVFFLLADTSYGSCCVDVVAAEHYDADSILHFGHSCLSPVEKLPVFYVFEKLPLDIQQVHAEISGKPGKLIVLYDCAYAYLHGTLFNRLFTYLIFQLNAFLILRRTLLETRPQSRRFRV